MATEMHQLGVQPRTTPPRAVQARSGAEQFAPLAGVGTLLFGLAGWIVLEGPAGRPEADVDPAAFLTYFGDRDAVIFGSFLLMLSVVCFLWFLGSLRTVLDRAEGGGGRVSAIAYGGGLVTAALMLALPGVSVLGALYTDELTAAGAKTLFLAGDAFLYPAAMTAAVLIAATALVALRTGAPARWLAWPSFVLALWLLIPPLGSAGGTVENPAAWTGLTALMAVPLWIAVTAVLLMRSSRDR